MTTTDTTTEPTAATPHTLEEFAGAFLGLRVLLAAAEEAQWKPGRTPVPREDTTERSKGMYKDPVFHTVTDERRVALRRRVLQAEAALAGAREAMTEAENVLRAALNA